MPLHLLFGTAAFVAGFVVILAWRVRESQRPVTTRSIVLPPLAMSTGLSMFALPAMRVPAAWALAALAAGALLLSGLMARTSRLERAGDAIVMRRSRAFVLVLLALAGARLLLREQLDATLPPMRTAALLYLLALGTVAAWRLRMLGEYRRLARAVDVA